MPDFPIVDSHVHLYDVERFRYSWMKGAPSLARTHVLKDFDAACGKVAVDGIVFAEVDVDPGLHLAEAEFIAGLGAADKRLCGSVAHAPVHKGAAVEPDLEKLAAIPGVKGIRRLIQGEVDPSMCIGPDFLAGVRLLPRHGLSFDICVKQFQMVYAVELVRRCPDTLFILDHIGKPDIKNGLVEPWKTAIRDMAALPNVVCKVSGVVTEADHKAWTRAEIRPYLNHVIESFGFDRVMYGSDWTVSTLACDYPTWVDVLDEVLASSSADELRKFWRGTAIRTYRLPLAV